ncbi:MAG: glycoside hydrolase family 127 protein [Armatimonadetes bacterium]|nr:glycoside hydrolase family 127 protein [Armatimonadota bacterium]
MLSLVLAASIAKPDLFPSSLSEVPFTEVTINDSFWAPRQATNRTRSIPHTLAMCASTPRLHNFELAAQKSRAGFSGLIFDDSDVYKSLEAACYALAARSDGKLEAQVDAVIAKIAAAQRPDGYLDTYYEINAPEKRFTRLNSDHELYCAGHLFEAAVAHYRATGKRSLLDVATKYADLLVKTFGDGSGKRMGYPGHPEAELALVKLYRVTGKREYFDLAKFFVDNRGSRFFAVERGEPKDKFDGTYWLDDVPIREHKEIKGHAVRAAYLMSGAADVATETKDPTLKTMLDRVWRNTVTRRMFVTGGIGPSGSNEGFTVDYDLPNLSAYQETCASVAMALWNHRMGLMEANAKYWDDVERALYNGFLAGVSLEGTHFFYVNPLASNGNHHRQEWFSCACCPPNVTRTLASLGSYVYAKSDDSLCVNLFVGGTVKTKVGGKDARLDVTTNYPWDGKIALSPSSAKPFRLKVRMPGWARSAVVTHNGKTLVPEREDGYLVLGSHWRSGDKFSVEFPMAVQWIQANPLVKDDAQRIALQRGPIVYCLEGVDNQFDFSQFFVPLGRQLTPVRSDKLGGIVELHGKGSIARQTDWRRKLYSAFEEPKDTGFTAIPYYAWDNREAGPMEVWLRTSPPHEPAIGLESSATVGLSFVSNICTPQAINDGLPVQASNKHPGQLCHFWPHKGSDEWVQYTFRQEEPVCAVEVYWFDDTGFGECRPPAAWHIEALQGGEWKAVDAKGYGVALDKWNRVEFPTVTTRALRLCMKLQDGWSVGIHEWRLVQPDD